MATQSHLGISQPSTIAAKVATVTVVRNSTAKHQELLSLADAEVATGIARVLDTAPDSTHFGLAVRVVGLVSPSTQVTVANFIAPSTQVAVSNFPAASTQVAVSNFPVQSTQVTVANFSTQVAVSNFPAASTQVAVSNFPAASTQVSVSNYSTTAEVRPVPGSTFATRPFQSSASELKVSAFLFDSTGNAIETSTRAVGTNSTMRGVSMRSMLPDCTYASGQASSAGDNIIVSSAAGTGIYVYAVTVSQISTVAQLIRLLNGSTAECWRVRTVAPSTIANNAWSESLAVSPPAYLFRTAAANPLMLNVTSSGCGYAVSAWRE